MGFETKNANCALIKWILVSFDSVSSNVENITLYAQSTRLISAHQIDDRTDPSIWLSVHDNDSAFSSLF